VTLINRIFYACLYTASCDLILNLDVGFSVRFAQLMMVFVLMGATARIIQDGRLLWPYGFTALSIWVLWEGFCLPLSGVITLGMEFYGLLVFTVLGVLAVTQLWGLDDAIEPLMRAYLWSYIFVAAWGTFQFLLPLLFHIQAPLTTQWLVHGRVARINGFSYEPSYFATYLFLGWIALVDLRMSKAEISSGKRMQYLTYGVGLVLFFSSSKTAWLAMAVEGVARITPSAARAVRRAVSSLRQGKLLVPGPGKHTGRNILVVALSVAVLVFGMNELNLTVTALLSGTGIGGAAAHSLNDRSGSAAETLDAFKQSPWIGRSLGGVAVAVGATKGFEVTNIAMARNFLGFPVIMDVLVASGIFGFIPFLVFLYQMTFGAFWMGVRGFPDERAKWLRALARAMILEWVLLASDQNLLRVYLWFHFAMIMVVSYHLEFGPSLASIRARKRKVIALASLEAPAV
jgi:hypothetical protein